MKLPIVSTHGEIIGFTSVNPKFAGTSVQHSYAERLLGGRVKAAYVEIKDPAAFVRVGAPLDWNGGWRCLALCSANMAVDDEKVATPTAKLCASGYQQDSILTRKTSAPSSRRGDLLDHARR